MIIGTAGHIDHGKTALVAALTGTDTDRLAEEKARGITIDLGFAYTDLGDGSVTGFVDVPGHERLVHTMVAGAGGIDLALIVIAADDGIMPQTQEHLAILSLLGVTRAVVAITKADLADPPALDELCARISQRLQATPMAGAPVLAVSARSGQGIDALRDLLARQAAETTQRETGQPCRVIIDRSFSIEGAGTVVTGILRAGEVRVGDQLTVSPAGLPVRVRGVRAQNRRVDVAGPGMRVALNLAGVARDQVGRGDAILAPELHAPTDRVDVALHWTHATPFRSGTRARLHVGSAEAEARLVPLGARLPDGAELVQMVLDRPLAVGWGDGFILRDPSASRTLGGGRLLDLRPPARRRATPERHAALRAWALPDHDAALQALLQVPPGHVDQAVFYRDRGLTVAEPGYADILGPPTDRMAFRKGLPEEMQQALTKTLAAYHEANPDLQGMGREALRLSLRPRLPLPVFEALLRDAISAGRIHAEAGFVRLPGHAPQMAPADEALYARIAPELAGQARFRPPRVRDLAGDLGVAEGEVRRVLKLAARLGRVDQIARDHFFLRATTAEMAAMIRDLSDAGSEGWFTAPAFRDRTRNGRKVAIEILDFFDRLGLTLRRGDLRRVNPHRAHLF